MELITIGRVVKAHGIDGTLKVFPLTDFPQRFELLNELFLVKKRVRRTTLKDVRFHKGYALIKVNKCSSRNDAEELIGAEVAIDSKDLWPLAEGEYFHFQLKGLDVVTEEGEYLGQIKQIMVTGANDVYVIENRNREYLLPAIKDVIKEVDLERKVMKVHLLKGLID